MSLWRPLCGDQSSFDRLRAALFDHQPVRLIKLGHPGVLFSARGEGEQSSVRRRTLKTVPVLH